MNNIKALDTADLQASVANYYSRRPPWIAGYISHSDSQFLAKKLAEARAETVIEIGTSSGFSAGLICHVLNFALQAGTIGPDFRVISYDISPYFRTDQSKKVGDAARQQLPSNLVEHIIFRNPATVLDFRKHHGRDEINFIFIDASHQHPWPTIDLFASLDYLSPGASVVLHDINLPIFDPKYQDWGAKYLFDEIDVEKEKDTPRDGGLYNIGSITIPADKERLKNQLLRIMFAHEWQVEIRKDYLELLGIGSAKHNE